ncbi:MAG: hypothetical protein ACTSXH_13020 [Promethearchaeota archaeon]
MPGTRLPSSTPRRGKTSRPVAASSLLECFECGDGTKSAGLLNDPFFSR